MWKINIFFSLCLGAYQYFAAYQYSTRWVFDSTSCTKIHTLSLPLSLFCFSCQSSQSSSLVFSLPMAALWWLTLALLHVHVYVCVYVICICDIYKMLIYSCDIFSLMFVLQIQTIFLTWFLSFAFIIEFFVFCDGSSILVGLVSRILEFFKLKANIFLLFVSF